jgi:peptide deformylase
VEGEGESIMEEGCLSLPHIEVPVKRMERVFIRGWDLNGEEVNRELIGFLGRVYQHEIDHLNGILIIHHISRLKRELLIKRMVKDLKRFQEKGSML